MKQKNKIESYNNSDIIGADKVHTVQVAFHKDPRKIRLFLGGNRCLAEGSHVFAPNNRKILIEQLKKGDIVLAVDPDTRETMPVPVEEVYDNGVQDVYEYVSWALKGGNYKRIWCTPNHFIYTADGLMQAGSIPAYTEIVVPEQIYYAGKYDPLPYLVGMILGTLSWLDEKPSFTMSSRNYRLAIQHCKKQNIETFIRRDNAGKCTAYGSLAKFLTDNCRDLDLFFTRFPYEWNNQTLNEFLSNFIPSRLKFKLGMYFIVPATIPESRFLLGALKSLGCSARAWKGKQDTAHPQIILGSPFDVQRLATKLKLPDRWARDMRGWAEPKIHFVQTNNYKFLRAEYNWAKKFPGKGKAKKSKTYDIKLAGGHNLFIADGFIVGNSGKTEAGGVEAYWFASGTHPYRSDIEVPNRGRIICESLDAFDQDIAPKFERWAPNYDLWKRIVGHQGKTAGYKLPNGSRIDVFTFDQKSKKLEGTSVRWCWCNEPPPRSHVIASQRGLVDQNGDLFFTLTPLSEPYLHTDFVIPSQTSKNKDIGLHTASIWQNPWLPKEAVRKFIESLDPAERAAREKGEFLHLMGRVFKNFDPKVHVIPTAEFPPSWPVCVGIDPHLRKDQIAVFLGRTQKGWYIALDEISYGGNDLAEFGQIIVETARKNSYDIQTIICDSFVNQPDLVRRDVEPKKVLDNVFKEAGLPSITIANKKDTKHPFILEMKRLLTPIEQPMMGRDEQGNPLKYPKFFVMDRCQGLIKDFANYVYKPVRRPELSGESEDPIKKYDDFLDSLKYALLADPDFIVRARRNHSPLNLGTYGIRSKN